MSLRLLLVLIACLSIDARSEHICNASKVQAIGKGEMKNLNDPSDKLLEKEFVRQASFCNKSELKKYLDIGVDINARVNFVFSKGVRAINQAAKYCDVAFVSWLIQEGANINVLEVKKEEDGYGQKPALVSAIKGKNREVVKFLIEHKDIDINSETLFRNTALSVAIDNDDGESVELLLAHPDIDIDKNPLSMLPYRANLTQAVHRPEIFSSLLNHNAHVKPFSRRTIRSTKRFLEVQILASERDGNTDNVKNLKVLMTELTAYEGKYIK